jgi:FMN-dependent NADH-azoreductase
VSNLLVINASPRGEASISRQLSTAAVAGWKAKNPDGKVVERDLAKTKLTFVDLDWITGSFATPEQQTDVHRQALALSDELVAEFLAAQEIIIATPMYNFAVPALLKAWIDHVVRRGHTFKYGPNGPVGLAGGRKVVVLVASGGVYAAGTPMEAYNYEIPYLRHILGFIGITDLTFVQAGGTMAVTPETAEAFLAPFIERVRAAV